MDVHAAALNGDTEEVQRYLATGGNPNLVNDAGITPLHSAAVRGQAEVIRILVAAGGDTDVKVCSGAKGTSHDASPLLLAVLGSFQDAAQVLLEAGAEVGAKNSKGLTPLHVSCLKPNARMVQLLLLWGADTNARDRKKRTPEQLIGRLGKHPAEEDAVRGVLQEASVKKQAALASSIHTSSHEYHDVSVDAKAVSQPLIELMGPGEGVGASVGIDPSSIADSALEQSTLPPPPPRPTASALRVGKKWLPAQAASAPVLPPEPPPPSGGDSDEQSVPARETPVSPRLPPPPPTSLSATSFEIGAVRDRASFLPFGGTDTVSATKVDAEPPPVSVPSIVAATLPVNETVPTLSPYGGGVGAGATFSFGAVINGEYELEKALPCSSGSSELWFACKVFTGEEVVIKRVSAGKEAAFERERAALKFLQEHGMKGGCQHSISLLGVIPNLRCLILGRGARNLRKIGERVYQRCVGNTAGYMDRVRPYARQVVEICQWLHRLGIVWGDIKPENFVEIQDGDLKAIDFDSACTAGGGMASRDLDVAERVGSRFDTGHMLTPRYCPPERARASVSGESFPATKASDVWSVGMVLFWLLTGQDYFEEGLLSDTAVTQSLCSPGFSVSLANVDAKQEQARNLLGTMLSHEPGRRGSMDSALGRAFFAGGASVTVAKIQAEMAASLGHVSTRLEATIREEAGSTRLLLDESMKRLESRAADILRNLGRMDRMLDSLVEDSSDCPHLFILTPATGTPAVWKPDTWFSEHNRLTFLCAHDLAPIGEGIKVPCPRSTLEKWAPAIQASAFIVKLGCKAACMTAGVSPAAVDGMSAALGINFLAGQKVSAALRSAAGKALGDVDKPPGHGNSSDEAQQLKEEDEIAGRMLTGEAYEALGAFLDEGNPSWRASLKRDMTKAVRGDGKVSWTCHEHAGEWSRSCSLLGKADNESGIATTIIDESSIDDQNISNQLPPSPLLPGEEQPQENVLTVCCESNPTSTSPPEFAPVTPVVDGCSSSGGKVKAKGVGVFAKFKGRFGRQAAARNITGDAKDGTSRGRDDTSEAG